SLLLGTMDAPRTRAMIVTGMLIANDEPHQKCSISHPPSTRPSAAPPPAMPDQIAIAFARSRDGKQLTRMLSVAGMTSAPPMPIARPAPTAVPRRDDRRGRVPEERRVRGSEPEQDDAGLHEPLAPEPVAERA